jgi:hypothetical protein
LGEIDLFFRYVLTFLTLRFWASALVSLVDSFELVFLHQSSHPPATAVNSFFAQLSTNAWTAISAIARAENGFDFFQNHIVFFLPSALLSLE